MPVKIVMLNFARLHLTSMNQCICVLGYYKNDQIFFPLISPASLGQSVYRIQSTITIIIIIMYVLIILQYNYTTYIFNNH